MKYVTEKDIQKILSIVLCIVYFQDDLFLKKKLRINCQSAKYIIEKDINIVSK